MADFRTRLRKAGYWLQHDLLTFDRILIGIAIAVCLACTWGAISSMTRNWALAQELANRQREKALLDLEVETLELENEYYVSAEYEELAARKYQGKMLPGETMVYLPANSDAAKNKHQSDADEPALTEATASNFAQWMLFLFGA